MLKNQIITALIVFSVTSAFPRPGDRMMSIELKNINGETCWFPDNTPVPVVVFYEEFGCIDTNIVFMNMILPLAKKKKIRICKVINMTPSWYLSNSFIYDDMKRTVRKAAPLEYYFDENELLRIKWRLSSIYSGSAILIINRKGILVQDIYGAMGWNEAVYFSKFLELVR